jgi:hypothetical protein
MGSIPTLVRSRENGQIDAEDRSNRQTPRKFILFMYPIRRAGLICRGSINIREKSMRSRRRDSRVVEASHA